MDKKLIKEYFSSYKKFNIKTVLKFFTKYPKIEKEINDILSMHPEWLNTYNIIYGIVYDRHLDHCKICNKTLKFTIKHHIYCSRECMLKDDDYLNKVKENSKKTFIEKYGIDNPWKLASIQQKNKDRFFEKYGFDNPWKVPDIIEKIKKKNAEHINEIVEKRRQTYLKNNPQYDNPSKNPKVIEKIKAKNGQYFKDKLWNRIQRWLDYIVPLFNKEDIVVGNEKFIYKWKCKKCGSEFEQRIYTTGHIKNLRECPRCFKCYPILCGTSKKEKELIEFCKHYFPNLLENDRQLIKPLELDIVIPDINLALEFNGNYWHSTTGWLDKNRDLTLYFNRHLNKTKICNEHNYRLIHIWEDEWDDRNDEIKSKLEKIFKGEEDLNFNDDVLTLDRSWFNNIEISNFILTEEIKPCMVKRDNLDVENCGYLKYERKVH